MPAGEEPDLPLRLTLTGNVHAGFEMIRMFSLSAALPSVIRILTVSHVRGIETSPSCLRAEVSTV